MHTLKDKTSEVLEQIETKRAEAMGAVAQDGQRQIIGLLYDQIMGDLPLLTAVTATAESIAVPKYATEKEEKWKQIGKHPYCTIVLATLTCVLTLSGSPHIACATSAMLTLLQVTLSLFANKHQNAQTVLQTETTLSLDDPLFERMLTQRLGELDKACKDVSRLSQNKTQSATDDPLIPQLYCELYTMEKLEDLDQAQYCVHLAEKLLENQGFTAVAYSEETAHLYQTTPSDMVDMTICPAICHASDQSLVSMGNHYVKEAQKGA